LPFLAFAREAADDSCSKPQFAYVRRRLSEMYDNFVEWLEHGMKLYKTSGLFYTVTTGRRLNCILDEAMLWIHLTSWQISHFASYPS
jgi:hypothetical protein